ncbi:IS3 family transposase [Neobacillus soli]|uniref:IS3 family transposase n=1 Tax=Neobacillus soli TaxID=220688 RepID=UPI000A02398A
MRGEKLSFRDRKCFIKKVGGNRKKAILSRVRNEVAYCAIRELNEKGNYPIQLLCTISKTNRSSYYKWLNRKETDQERENRELLKKIKALYEKVDGIYGYRRITMNLNREMNKQYNAKRIHRLMQLVGLQSKIRRKRNGIIVLLIIM